MSAFILLLHTKSSLLLYLFKAIFMAFALEFTKFIQQHFHITESLIKFWILNNYIPKYSTELLKQIS